MRTVSINEKDRTDLLDFVTKSIGKNYYWIVYNDTRNGNIIPEDLVCSVRLQGAEYICERRNAAENSKYQYPETQYKYMPLITMARLLQPNIDLSQFQNNNIENERYRKDELILQRGAAEKMDEGSNYILKTNNSTIMNEKNLESLKKQVMYTGFGNLLDIQLEENMKKDLPDFQLHHKHEFGKDAVASTLNFRRSEQGNYFFNSYDIQLNKEGSEPQMQTFKVSRPQEVTQKPEGMEAKSEWVNSTITLKEAYNLMEGRSVLKDFVSQAGEKYANWVSLDFKETDDKGNYLIKKRPDFDLEAKVATLPIKDLSNEESKKELIDSLKKGNRQSVTVLNDGVEQKFYLEASPQFKTINRYEGTQRVAVQERETNSQAAKQSNKEAQKAESDDEGGRTRQRRSTKKGHGISS